MSSPRRIILLGATGSIGRSTLEVVEHLAREAGRPRFEVAGLAARRDVEALAEQAQRFGVLELAVADEDAALELRRRLPQATVHVGADAASRLVESVARPGDLVVGAMVGVAGLAPTMAAIARGCDIALANKETLVAAGGLVMPLARRSGVRILPVDSEHSALFQCLEGERDVSSVKRLVITASGGPFRTWDAERMRSATVEEALNHPTWRMGPKVTIDSASLMNKALEMIEAYWLFGVEAERIEAIIHPQSIVHGFVEFVDGSVVAQIGAPDMRTPIQHALTYPERAPGCSATVDWLTLRRLDFEPVDEARFPAVGLAQRVLRMGGTAGAVLNAANEAAVEAFLRGEVAFGHVPELVAQALDAVPARALESLDDVESADAAARVVVREAIAAVAER